MLRLLLVFLALACCLPLSAQDDEFPAPPEAQVERELDWLLELAPALRLARDDLEEAREKLAAAATEAERAELEEAVNTQRQRLEELRNNFRTLSSGIEEERFLGTDDQPTTWDQSLKDLLDPLSRAMRELTAGPRELEELKRNLESSRDDRELSAQALERIDALIELVEEEAVIEELRQTRELWQGRLARATSEQEVFEQQVEMRQSDRRSMFEKVSDFFASFWRSRGLNLVMAAVAVVLVVWLVVRGYRLLRRLKPFRGRSGFASRASDLMAKVVAGLLAVLAVVLVFYLRGDWLMLALSIVLLLGLLWASKAAIPPYIEQIRLILNVGPVREGERLIYNGIPWRVERLNFYCRFKNPELSGGVLRLPVQEVTGLLSRAQDPREPWFPTEENDWVVLSDEIYGKVVEQTPDQVVVLRLGGSRKTYPTPDFLALSPENLSRGFRVSVNFGIDYMHQAISVEEVPGVFCDRLELTLNERFGREQVRSVKVEFASAGASSLDYAVLADFDGEVASRRNVIERLIQATCVEVCNEHGWTIPFTQVTVHQAVDDDAAAGAAAGSTE